MNKQMKSLYEGLRTTLEANCTVETIADPKIVIGPAAVGNGYVVSRPVVDEVQVVVCMKGSWMIVTVKAIKAVVLSVIGVIRKWCHDTLGSSEIEEVPDFIKEAIAFA